MLAVEVGQEIGIKVNIQFGVETKLKGKEMKNDKIIQEHIEISNKLNILLDKLDQLQKEKEKILSGIYKDKELVNAMQKNMEEYDKLSLEMKKLRKRSEELKKHIH